MYKIIPYNFYFLSLNHCSSLYTISKRKWSKRSDDEDELEEEEEEEMREEEEEDIREECPLVSSVNNNSLDIE